MQAATDSGVAATVDTGTDWWTGTPLAEEHWLESASGFPEGGVGSTAPASRDAVVASAREAQLTRRQLDEVLAFTEFLAGQALPAADREELEDDLVDAFQDSPRRAVRFLRSLAGGVRRVHTLDPTERCQRRLKALTTTYTIEQRRQADGADLSPIMAVVSRYNPVVKYWATTGIVLVADALTARIEQHRLVLSMVGRQPEPDDQLRQRLLDGTAHIGVTEIAELAASQLRLLGTRAWLRDLGKTGVDRFRTELARAVDSALDVDLVVQQVGYRAALHHAGLPG